MAMKRCKSCSGVVSFGAEACPHCGMQLRISRLGIASLLGALALLIFLAITGVE
jgi:hypothetical protein